MASDDLDLQTGEPGRSDSASERRARRRKSGDSSSGTSQREQVKIENEVRTQVARAFDGIAKNRYAHDDIELGDAFTEESDAMTEGFVTLTTNVVPLRMPLIVILNLMITLLAFGRVGQILYDRVQVRRETRRMAAEAAMDPQPGPTIVDAEVVE
jgi:hypothetical protein